jgi:hypothetical protein
MSGYGVAADPSGNIYFVTGNSDYSGTTYNGVTNVPESVVKMSADLTQLLSIFTPSDEALLDEYDEDLGSGGVMLLPQYSSKPLAAAAGKEGTMYLLDQNSLGGYVKNGRNHDLAEVSIGGCWCGPSYFAEKKTHQRIVASGGSTVSLWEVKGKRKPRLTLLGSAGLPSGQDPGFFTTVSSRKSGGNAIIWALARPEYAPGPLTLVASNALSSFGRLLDRGEWKRKSRSRRGKRPRLRRKLRAARNLRARRFLRGVGSGSCDCGFCVPRRRQDAERRHRNAR